MSYLQTNAKQRNPNNLNLTSVATYERTIGAPLVRVWENVLDWEHLPWLHHSSFDYIELDEGGSWGWRTWSDAEHTGYIELTVATDDSYVARTYQAGNQVSEIWTTLSADGDKTHVQVEFLLPDVAADSIDKLGEIMTTVYTRLWNEDEAMMIERHSRLHEQKQRAQQVNLGTESEIRARLSEDEAVIFQLGGREYRLVQTSDTLTAQPTVCPHLLGPLTSDGANELFCPWHGYRFDLKSGKCLSPEDAKCKLPPAPNLEVAEGHVTVSTG